MSTLFYPKLALSNIKKNSKIYAPYLVAGSFVTAMFFIIVSLAARTDLTNSKTINNILTEILFFGVMITGVICVIILFYANNFLMKRRKKEFGIYNILGMEKRHISRVLFYETVFSAAICIICGVLFGMLFSQLVYLLVSRMIGNDFSMGFEVSGFAVALTVLLFAAIFALTMLNNFRHIYFSNPVELLSGSNRGEKEPKANWILALLGVLCLGGGYAIAVIVEQPITAVAIFFVAVLLVILGTYFLFAAGSIALLKLLRKNKKYYYKTKHFISVSSMIYRMKQNAVGLATICILSTAVLVMISSTVSLYAGAEDTLKRRYPREFSLNLSGEMTPEESQKTAGQILSEKNLEMKNIISSSTLDVSGTQNGDSFSVSGYGKSAVSMDDSIMLFITAGDFEALTGESVSLEENQVKIVSEKNRYKNSAFAIGDLSYDVVSESSAEDYIDSALGSVYQGYINSTYYVVLKDDAQFEKVNEAVLAVYKGNDAPQIMSRLMFDCSEKLNTEGAKSLGEELSASPAFRSAQSRTENEASYYSMFGGLLFLGIFLGILFAMVTVLIMYYKQMSEGYDDRERFEIMQKVGLSKGEIKRSIRSQVLTVFFLPLLAAGVHIAFAFGVITKLLALFNMTNVTMFALCTAATLGCFALFYALVYHLTAKMYYKIVA